MCSPHSLQHILDRAFGLRELLCIAGAQHHMRIGAVLRIEEWIAPDRDPRIGLGDLTELHSDVAFGASVCTVSESIRTPILSLGATSSSIACMIEATLAITITFADPEARRPRHLVEDEIRALGNAPMRRRASFISAPVVFTHSCRMARARPIAVDTPSAPSPLRCGKPRPLVRNGRPGRLDAPYYSDGGRFN